MTEVPMNLAEIEARITVLRENISQLVEQATAYSGAADEDRTSERIAEQEAQLQHLINIREKLLEATPGHTKA